MLSPDFLQSLFPPERTARFFEALLGDPEEGAYDISLHLRHADPRRVVLEFHLRQRPGKCLACNLTHGLPDVFARHPVIDIEGLATAVGRTLNGSGRCSGWQLGATREVSQDLHVIPLTLNLEK